MPTDIPAVIDKSIAQLESLATCLADEIQQPWTTGVLPLSERRLCKEALLTVTVLLPKLHAVQRAQARTMAPRGCQSCEE